MQSRGPAREYTEHAVAPFAVPRDQIPWATSFRSTWIISSLDSLRKFGHFDHYLSALRALTSDSSVEQQVLTCVAGAWVPLAITRLHYEACNVLSLPEDELVKMANDAGDVRRAWHAQFITSAQRAEATAWTTLPQLHKLWTRTADGGAAAVYRTAEKRARVEYAGCALFDIRHFRHAVRAVLVVLAENFGERSQVTTRPSSTLGSVDYLIQWT